jgi:uncharacterized protein YprB with RNaseH-like and TPR domain
VVTDLSPTPTPHGTVPSKEPRILVWDIESTGLNATFGTILCIGWKWHGAKAVKCPTILDGQNKDMLDDKALVQRFVEAFAECDYHITWYGKKFDHKMIQSKLIRHGLDPLPPKPHLDLWETARRHFRLHSNRLVVWQEFLDVAHTKTPIDFRAWREAALGSKKAMKDVVSHCIADVWVLEEVFDRLRPWIETEPARRLFHPQTHRVSCVSCGSHHVTKQGYKVSKTRKYQQWKCQDCGKWMKTRLAEKDAPLFLIGDA